MKSNTGVQTYQICIKFCSLYTHWLQPAVIIFQDNCSMQDHCSISSVQNILMNQKYKSYIHTILNPIYVRNF